LLAIQVRDALSRVIIFPAEAMRRVLHWPPAKFLMLKSAFTSLCLVCLFAVALTPQTSTAQDATATPSEATVGEADSAKSVSSPEYQTGFQTIYNAWRDAMHAKSYPAWKEATAAYRQAEIRNRIVSQKQLFPDAMFDVPLSAPQLAQLNMIDIFVKGPTATAVYFGKLDFGVGGNANTPDSFLVLRFAGEGDAWKFDNMRVIKFGTGSEILQDIRQGDFGFLQDPEFQPSGVVPPVAAPVSVPSFLAELWVSAIGYEATVTINSQHRSTVVNNTGRDLVIGGLNRGDNRVAIAIKPDPKADPSIPKRLEVAVYAAGNESSPAERVYHYRGDPNAMPEGKSDTIKLK